MLDKGAKIDSELFKKSPLHIACLDGNIEIAKLLIDKGADVNFLSYPYKSSPLHDACKNSHTELVNFLLENGANIDSYDDINHYSPICYAIRNGHTEIVKLILDKIETYDLKNLKKIDDEIIIPNLEYATKSNQHQMLTLLEESHKKLLNKSTQQKSDQEKPSTNPQGPRRQGTESSVCRIS